MRSTVSSIGTVLWNAGLASATSVAQFWVFSRALVHGRRQEVKVRKRTAERWKISKQLIDLEALKTVALDTRTKRPSQERVKHTGSATLTCEVTDPWLSGSYNFFYMVHFSDGVTWLVRIAGKGRHWEEKEIQKQKQEYQTLDLIRRSTKIPVPEVFLFSPKPDMIGRAFALLSYLPGTRLFDKWSDETWATEEKRLKILAQIAGYMSQLGKLPFQSAGGLLFSESNKFSGMGPVYDYVSMLSDGEDTFMVTSYGPWVTAQHYQRDREGRMNMENDKSGEIERKLITLASRSIPDFMYGHGTYLSHADVNLQNILVDDDASVTGIVDWDFASAKCRSMGYAAYPFWLTHDWDPYNYAYANDSHTPFLNHSRTSPPGDLRRWRKYYAEVLLSEMAEDADLGNFDSREVTHSHIVQAIEYAMVSKPSRAGIVEKLLDHAFLSDVPFELAKLVGGKYSDVEKERVLQDISKAFDEMWLREPE